MTIIAYLLILLIIVIASVLGGEWGLVGELLPGLVLPVLGIVILFAFLFVMYKTIRSLTMSEKEIAAERKSKSEDK